MGDNADSLDVDCEMRNHEEEQEAEVGFAIGHVYNSFEFEKSLANYLKTSNETSFELI